MTMKAKKPYAPQSAKPLNVAEAKARLSELVRRAAEGEEIIIARNGEPQARLVAMPSKVDRIPGAGAGKWKVGNDFNDPLPDALQRAFHGDIEAE